MIRAWLLDTWAEVRVLAHYLVTGRPLCSCQSWKCPYSRGEGWHQTPN
jgi:hypothetical protein